MKPILRRLLCIITIVTVALQCGCSSQRSTVQLSHVQAKTLIYEFDKGWLRYRVFRLPEQPNVASSKKAKEQSPLEFSIRIINKEDGTSPLRKLCGSLDEYNTYYAYLLNEAKNDIVLIKGNEVLYPISYSFENSYNAYPFETINVGYSRERVGKLKKAERLQLFYQDKIFSHDTLMCQVGTLNKLM